MLDVLREPCECLGGVRLCLSTNISSSQRSEQVSCILVPLPLTWERPPRHADVNRLPLSALHHVEFCFLLLVLGIGN